MLPYTCSKCGLSHNRAFRRGDELREAKYCWTCQAAYARAHRPKHRDLSEEQRKRANTRSYSNVLKARGEIVKQPCAHCGSANSQMHHPDYSNARLVEWLCRACHLKHHHEERAP